MGFVCSTALASVTSLSPYSFDRSAEVDAIMIMIMIRMIMMVIRNTMMAVERNYDLAENVVKFTLLAEEKEEFRQNWNSTILQRPKSRNMGIVAIPNGYRFRRVCFRHAKWLAQARPNAKDYTIGSRRIFQGCQRQQNLQ